MRRWSARVVGRVGAGGVARVWRAGLLTVNAWRTASKTVRNIHWFEVVETRGHVVDGKIAHWQVTIKAGFTLDD